MVSSKAFFNILNHFKPPNSDLPLKKYNLSETYNFNERSTANFNVHSSALRFSYILGCRILCIPSRHFFF